MRAIPAEAAGEMGETGKAEKDDEAAGEPSEVR